MLRKSCWGFWWEMVVLVLEGWVVIVSVEVVVTGWYDTVVLLFAMELEVVVVVMMR